MGKQRLTPAQKQQVSQFQGITGAAKDQAAECLQASQWNVEAAINLFFNSGLTGGTLQEDSAVTSLYEKYKDQQQDAILADGVGRFCQDLKVDPSDIVMLVISWHFSAATMCEFTKEEFLEGMEELNCNSVDKVKRKLPLLRNELKNDQTFQEVYNYAYGFACEKGQKCLQLDTAIAMWQLLFAEQGWPLINLWCQFLEANHKHAISKDTWSQLLDFARIVRTEGDLEQFDASNNSAWPYLIDDFVDQLRATSA